MDFFLSNTIMVILNEPKLVLKSIRLEAPEKFQGRSKSFKDLHSPLPKDERLSFLKFIQIDLIKTQIEHLSMRSTRGTYR